MVRFLILPNVVKCLVFKEMELYEILLLSFCSKRVQKSIQQTFTIGLNKGFRITCPDKMNPFQDMDEKRLELIVDHKGNDKKVISWKYVTSLSLIKQFKYPKGPFILKINGIRCKCSVSFHSLSGIPILYFEKDLMKKLPMELHKHCVEVFRTTPGLEMIMNLNDSSDLDESQPIKDLYLHDSYEKVDPRIADEFFEKANIQNCFSVVSQKLEGAVSDDSKFWNIPNILIYSHNWVFAHQLVRFTGKNAYFFTKDYPCVITQDMNAFLKHWLNGNNTNLEIMMAGGYRGSMDGLFNGIKMRRWDPRRRPARYVSNGSLGSVFQFQMFTGSTFSNFFDTYFSEFDYLDCRNAFDIVRESDGWIASVKVEFGIFFMFVWHHSYTK
ncbi:hypothetical protein B9Z55_004190 [Caenorhabditis nigoni]|uniref:Sdz-33 F-box domain-containing protein n=1 Tax=Caenorhabditis nigoni TaxID=1611254 RepID=A0A2G5UVB3_9PELO|nr:hypothetical protein B9Z55_004190 [Caenorhabditis nigoni]